MPLPASRCFRQILLFIRESESESACFAFRRCSNNVQARARDGGFKTMLKEKARGFESAKNFNCASARQQAVLVDKARAALLQSGTFHAKEIMMAEPVLMEKKPM